MDDRGYLGFRASVAFDLIGSEPETGRDVGDRLNGRGLRDLDVA